MNVAQLSSSWVDVKLELRASCPTQTRREQRGTRMVVIKMRDRGKNRKPLQRGRNLSIEAIQAVQALKRAHQHHNSSDLDQVFYSKFRRLLKFDMIAVLRELLRQNQCLVALKVFEDRRREYWYKPQVLLYAEMIQVLSENGLFEQVEIIYMFLKRENHLEPDIEGFNAVLKSLVSFKLIGLVMDCYNLMKAIDCEPDRSSFRILINGLEVIGESGSLGIIRQDALKYYGNLEFLEEEEEITASQK
ncbi:pentatricopeptide repeat-containing protein At1g62350-like isoform X1 [Pistacia vera]|uniref:pentatricopeptide repeat-containing protein At1g62350-like isoform X1 n=1 Tax=Pistacia vera TaxID=55513 RepID=UPI001262D5C6|nr:pentatricopeptide repeat-containing protein At1g62350-like isoform X1 [Pistacia vera]XP_031270554.1 pentatricopeptide repeat-containing protein At1g62350-like isoform X1 [Pistacia vera]